MTTPAENVIAYCESIIASVEHIKQAVTAHPDIVVVTDGETSFDFLAGIDEELDGLAATIDEDGSIGVEGWLNI